jgi:hypothetical protein
MIILTSFSHVGTLILSSHLVLLLISSLVPHYLCRVILVHGWRLSLHVGLNVDRRVTWVVHHLYHRCTNFMAHRHLSIRHLHIVSLVTLVVLTANLLILLVVLRVFCL